MDYLLETPRLLLREFNEMDGNAMYLLNADPDVIKYTGDPPFESPHEAQQFLIDYPDYKKHGFGRWAVVEKESDQFVGWCGLKRHEDGMVDVGFRFYKTVCMPVQRTYSLLSKTLNFFISDNY